MTNASDKKSDLPKIGVTELVDVGCLKLDVENPRLLETDGSKGDEYIISDLYKSEDLSELLHSISTNGYMNIEPLVVVLDEDDDEEDKKLTVLEGNRRLAAILLLLNNELVQKTEEVGRIRIDMPEISEEHKKSLSEISVYRVQAREHAREFIGFKHINGPAKWDSYAKAKFAASWHKEAGVSLEEIANRIGDRHDTIKRMVVAIFALEQAEESGVYELSDKAVEKFNFSHLYTALSRSSYMNYLGLGSSATKIQPKPNLIPEDKIALFGEVLVWIYGSKKLDVDPVVRKQNPDIKNLGEVLESAEGLLVLRAKKKLDEAHDSTISSSRTFSEALIHAKDNIGVAASNLHGYDGKDEALLSIAQNVSKTARAVVQQMAEISSEVNGENDDN